MAFKIRLACEPVRSLAFGSIGAAYAGIGTSMTRPIRIFLIQNLTETPLMFSFDGITDHFPIASYSYLLLDITSNMVDAQGFFLAEGSRVYVKEISTPTTGAAYLTTSYAAD